MREYLFTIAFATLIAPANLFAQDSVITRSISYSCFSTEIPSDSFSLKMKEYFDPKLGYTVGLINTFINETPIETTNTVIYEISLPDNQSFMKMWYAPKVRVEAHLLISDKRNTFDANYVASEIKKHISCTKYENH